VLDFRGSFFRFWSIFASFDQKSNFQKRAFSGNPSNFRFPNTCFQWFRIADDVLPMRDTICEFSMNRFLRCRNDPQRGSCNGTTERSVGENAKRSTRGSRSRTVATPVEGGFQYRFDLSVEAILRSSLLHLTGSILPSSMPPSVSTYTRILPSGSTTGSLYNRILYTPILPIRAHPRAQPKGTSLRAQPLGHIPSTGKYLHSLPPTPSHY
jgi:hypothetical protein